MLKRQDSLVASARRQTPPAESEHVVMSSGCMSGIIQLISKYQKKTKRLTSGIRKQGKVVERRHEKEDDHHLIKVAKIQPENVTKKEPTLVARLMGLEESSPTPTPPSNRKSTELKRRKLLQALDKCNDDLESIRNILNSLKKVTPSPFCNQFTKPKHINGHIPKERKARQRIKRVGAYEAADKFTNNASLFNMIEPVGTKSCSKAMIQSVEEVWDESEWGQKREAGRIGLILQHHICRDLIEEFLKEMDLLISFRSLPFLACKKRLLF